MRTATVRRGTRTAAVVATLTLAAACTADGGPPASSGGNPFFAARSAAPVVLLEDRGCDAVLDDIVAFAPDVLGDQLFGMGVPDMAVDTAMPTTAVAERDGADMSFEDVAGAGEAAGGTSDTNTQEAGIDEPDVVETDGEHVYVVDQEELVILDGATAQVRSRTPLASWGSQLLLQGDRLLVISGGMGYGVARPMPAPMPIDDVSIGVDAVEEAGSEPGEPGQIPPTTTEPGPVDPEPAPVEPEPVPVDPEPVDPVDPVEPVEPEPIPVEPEPMPIPIDPPTFQAGTVLQLIDVSDRSAPRVLQTTEIEGSHVTTRVVDGVARIVIASWPDPWPLLEGVSFSGDGSDAIAGARASLAARVAETDIGDWLPAFRATVLDDGDAPVSDEGALVACEDVLIPEVNAGIAQTSILRVDFTDGFDPAHTTTVVAEAGTVYASASTLYLAANRYVPVEDQGRIVDEGFTTALHAFDLGGEGAAAHVGAGEIPGHVLNQYSLSEHDGHLRVATTEGSPWGGGAEPSQSGVRVLRLDGGSLVEVGSVTGLGVTETIHSVRFMGPVGYVVTFRQTDPLYVIDLADPTAPRAVGELKIPGFSSYLHPVGEGLLVGIGRDADLQGRDQGLLVSLFDVRDPTAPTQLQTWIEGDAWSSAGDDPKAFLWWAPESAVVVPIERWGATADRGGDLGAGMLVLDVDESGIAERATVEVPGRWPSRALVVQGRLWSLFDGGVHVSEFANPTQGTFTGFR
jgi:hypothetical protein